jgi:NADH-quinone oxidoreductase subunit C
MTHMSNSKRSVQELQTLLSEVLGAHLKNLVIDRGDVIASVSGQDILHVLKTCKENPQLGFNMLIDVTAVDWMDAREQRFEVVYQLLNLGAASRLTIKVPISESSPVIASATSIWNGANFLEREVFDMFGIRFEGHKDLRRILMYDEFVGHPLRKDYPVQAKQPRIPLRMPEVENTARRMQRPDLVSIRPKQSPIAERGARRGDQEAR